MGYRVKEFYTLDDLHIPDLHIEEGEEDIKMSFQEYHNLFNALHLISRKFPNHKIDIRLKL